jgi:DNA-binding NarL/FixJ family response regulator
MTITVLLVDDQEMVRTAMRVLIQRREGLRVIGDVGDGEQAVESAFRLRPDVVLMDVRMPGVTGVEATRRILTAWPYDDPPPRILVLTTFDLDEYVYEALRAGAAGFLLKNTEPDELARAIRVVAAGEAMLSPTITKRLIGAFNRLPANFPPGTPIHAPGTALDTLTERELQVLILIGQGLSNTQIAKDLDVSEATVKSRVNRILSRLGLTNRVQAAILAHQSGLLPPLRDH